MEIRSLMFPEAPQSKTRSVSLFEKAGERLISIRGAFLPVIIVVCFSGIARGQGAGSPETPGPAPSVVVSRVIGEEAGKEPARSGGPKIEVVVAPTDGGGGGEELAVQEAKPSKKGGGISPRKAVMGALVVFAVSAFLFRRQILKYILDERKPLPPIEPFDARPVGRNLNTMARSLTGPVTAPGKVPKNSVAANSQTQAALAVAVPGGLTPGAMAGGSAVGGQAAAPASVATAPPGSVSAVPVVIPAPLAQPAVSEAESRAYKRLKIRPKRPWE